MTTISSSTTLGITLSPAYYSNRVVIEQGAVISNSAGGNAVGVYPGAFEFFTIENDGVIAAAGSAASSGVYLAPGGYVTNAMSASITGGMLGVKISGGPGTVVNDGSVGAIGASGIGILLYAGGFISNASAGSITGAAAGVNISGGVGTLVNDGIIGNVASAQSGVNLFAGGSVTNAGSGLIGGAFAVYVAGDIGTVINAASIVGSTGFGIDLFAGGFVSNATAGAITGATLGIVVSNHAGTVVNDGRITVTYAHGIGIALHAGGAVTNDASGSIIGGAAGAYGAGGGGATVVNHGVIEAMHGTGVVLLSGGSVSNAASAALAGSFEGVQLGAGGTLTNAGTIIGNSGTAVAFGGTNASRLILAPGFDFSGLVVGSASASNTLELTSGSAAGTITGLGTQYSNFGTITFDPGSNWFIAGGTLGLAGTIAGFAVGDTIELTGITATGSSYVDGILKLDSAIGPVALDLPGFTLADFTVTDVANGTDVTVSCFRTGTRIRAARGEIPVERLLVGETVLAHAGDGVALWRPIVWIGRRVIDCKRHPRPRDVWPVRIAAGTFGRGKPRSDLYLSPDHAVFVDGVLIPVRLLIDGVAVAQVPVATVTYFHVELAAHSIMLAEQLSVESYLDTGDRANFATGGGMIPLHPEFAIRTWEAHGCAELVVAGPLLAAARSRICMMPA